MRRNQHRLLSCTTILCAIVCGLLSVSVDARALVNPHWTGTHCTECHAAKGAPALRSNGDVEQTCNRCHGSRTPACTKAHSGRETLSDDVRKDIPGDWPLSDSGFTCLTCHAVHLQMYADAALKKQNKNFLRGGTPGDLAGFCFSCHQRERYQKVNPHRYPETGGADSRSLCRRCHTEGLATGLEVGFAASVKTKSADLCVGCHGALGNVHLQHAALGSDELRPHEAALRELNFSGIELPLADGRMHCSTCHNQHPEGVIGRKEAATGAGETFFLRIPRVDELCAVCHAGDDQDLFLQRFRNE